MLSSLHLSSFITGRLLTPSRCKACSPARRRARPPCRRAEADNDGQAGPLRMHGPTMTPRRGRGDLCAPSLKDAGVSPAPADPRKAGSTMERDALAFRPAAARTTNTQELAQTRVPAVEVAPPPERPLAGPAEGALIPTLLTSRPAVGGPAKPGDIAAGPSPTARRRAEAR
mmetsp:Transcript_13151/g.37863  ORF Transcript_13151/g.37863 Transcript_13151/m.37863 type:complete len:171 (+) Transcript_13151:127-639(+)